MGNLLKKILNWNKNRVERNYERIISQYSPEEQELIRKGRDVDLYYFTPLNELEKKAKEFYPEIIRIEALTSPYTVNGKKYSHQPMPYRKVSLGFRNYEVDIEYWKEIGKLNPDALASVGLLGGDMVQQLVGIPIRFIKNNSQNV